MLTQLEKTLILMTTLNSSHLIKTKVSQEEINEQYKNIKDLQNLLKKYSSLVDNANVNNFGKEGAEDLIARIHPILIDLQWHIDQIDELLRNVLKGIPSDDK